MRVVFYCWRVDMLVVPYCGEVFAPRGVVDGYGEDCVACSLRMGLRCRCCMRLAEEAERWGVLCSRARFLRLVFGLALTVVVPHRGEARFAHGGVVRS